MVLHVADGTRPSSLWASLALIVLVYAPSARGQSAAPETAPTLFPGGGLVSAGTLFTTRSMVGPLTTTARPTLSHEEVLNFTWGFFRDFDLTILLPVVTNRFDIPNARGNGGTGFGDSIVLIKYRFLRRDSERGTTQASVTVGPKVPTGRTNLVGTNGTTLPAGLQPGSGSTDLFLGANWTYTGLFHIKRLVADEDIHGLIRTQGIQATHLGDDIESRFWLSYRPYEARDGAREWFIGPAFTWLHSQDDRTAGVTYHDSGGEVALAGITTYVGVRPGMHVWFAMDWDVAHSRGDRFMPVQRYVSFGVTQQFRMHLLR
jgi:hypothetical protein